MSAFLQYTAARVALFLACWGVLWLVGAKGVLGVLLALIVSGLLSYVLLHRVRDRFAGALAGGVRGLRQRTRGGRADVAEEPDAQQVEREG